MAHLLSMVKASFSNVRGLSLRKQYSFGDVGVFFTKKATLIDVLVPSLFFGGVRRTVGASFHASSSAWRQPTAIGM